ncbi:MFS transporter [Cellulomonas triticagri]|uniref:MFS transporter n=1 Tax=Cellulomonas triticagri TaxID=2483352 RepID=A0A3M2JJG1_9CELL|nr:MFS transporter [Cellulomonas triticagri]RMI13819.1 MFS transporter [Cellulomonas triticagri]
MENGTSKRRWALLATVGAGLLLITLDNSILYTALPTLTAELGASGSTALWIINAYPVMMAGLLLGAGTLGDRVGHRRMFVVGLSVFGIASLAAAFAPSPELLIAARALLAVGAASMMPATLALIRLSFDDERERNLAIAIWGSLSVVGAALGPILGGTLLQHFWWGSVFLINVPVVIAALIATAIVAPHDDADPSKRWDLVSSLQAMVGLVGAVLFIKELAHVPQNWVTIAVAAVAAAVGFSLFVRRQRKLDEPMLEFSIFRNKAFSGGVIAAAFAMFTIAGAQLVTTQRFQLVEGFSPLEAGLLVATIALGSLPSALIGGAFLHLLGLRLLISGGLGVGALGVATTVAAVATGAFPLLVIGFVVTGLGLGGAFSVASAAIMGNAHPRKAGMAASVEEVSYEFGSLSAVALLGSLLTFVYSATVKLPPGSPDAARESLSDALAHAGGDKELIAAANAAFDTSYLVTMVVLGVMLVLGALVTNRLLRAYGRGTEAMEHAENH